MTTDLLINNYDNPAIALIPCTDNETKTLEMAIFYKRLIKCLTTS